MPNIKATINAHNKKITKQKQHVDNARTCNCRNENDCPLQRNCQAKSIIYEATLTSDLPNQDKKYIGLSQNTFKKRFSSHKTSFRLDRYRHSTTLSTEYWKLKDKSLNPTITWKLLHQNQTYTPNLTKMPTLLN